MSTRAVKDMLGRIQKSLSSGLRVVMKSVGQPSVQMVLGLVIVVYTAFLESDKESILSILMSNPIGRLLVLGFLALLAVAAPPVAVMFAVLVVMSYVGPGSEGYENPASPDEEEGFWVNTGDDKPSTKKEEDPKKESSKDKDESSTGILGQLKKLSSSMSSVSPFAKTSEEGFGQMFESAYSNDNDDFSNEEDAHEFMKSMNSLGGISGHSKRAASPHSFE